MPDLPVEADYRRRSLSLFTLPVYVGDLHLQPNLAILDSDLVVNPCPAPVLRDCPLTVLEVDIAYCELLISRPNTNRSTAKSQGGHVAPASVLYEETFAERWF